jgi:hypothetical protein
MDPNWFPALSTELEFEIRRQQIGLTELVNTDPARVATFAGDLLRLTRLQELALRGAMARVIELEAAEHRRGCKAAGV